MKVIIAEKPSVAQQIAAVVGVRGMSGCVS